MDTKISRMEPEPVLSDRLLLEQAYAGDDAAFETLVHRYETQLYCFVCANLDSNEAEDVVQFVWVQLYRCLSILQQDSSAPYINRSLKPWLFRVAWNRCLDERRRRKKYQTLFFHTLGDANETDSFSAILDPAPLPEERVERREEQETLHAAIQTLPPKARAVVWLRYRDNLPFRDIAQRLQIPTDTARITFYRACTKLRVALSSKVETSIAS